MNTEHTPGPWHVDYAQGIIAADGTVVAYVEADHSDTPTPDGNLIAAAPDLLEALRDMYSGWKYIRQVHGDLYGVGWDRCDAKARAAIAKAEGKS